MTRDELNDIFMNHKGYSSDLFDNEEYAEMDSFVDGYQKCLDDLLPLLMETKLQLEYLNGKFKKTGTTEALLAKIDTQINHIICNQK